MIAPSSSHSERTLRGDSTPAWTLGRRAAVFSSGVNAIPNLAHFFAFDEILYRPHQRESDRIDAVLIWGNKETGKRARAYAQRHNKPVWRVEDGFFRSVNPGNDEGPLSLVLDDVGIYYDAHRPSRLESVLNLPDTDPSHSRVFGADVLDRTRRLLAFVLENGLSKYNNGSAQVDLPATSKERVLLIDQTRADAAISGGLATEKTFVQMVDWAFAEFPNAEILIKTHPEVLSGKKTGCIPAKIMADRRVRVLTRALGPIELSQAVDHVVTVTSQFGFDALCAGKSVTCFGMPFYAGWGLTDDKLSLPRRSRRRSLLELAAASWIHYPSYVDPISGQRCTPEEALSHLGLQRTAIKRNEGKTFAVGFSGWKRPHVLPFLGGPNSTVAFVKEAEIKSAQLTARNERVVVWGQHLSPETRDNLRSRGVPLLHMEDGFLRSNELGSDLTRPASVVLDSAGIYYDARSASDLETMLESREFSPEERTLGGRLIEEVTRHRLSKYNVQQDAPLTIPQQMTRPVHLVIGQVEDDASVLLSTRSITCNHALLAKVRELHPDAYLIYKPHPDVVSGNRKGALSPEEEAMANQVEATRSIAACLDVAGQVHTMTSLVGFEALLRNIPVSTYGLPFYAGWGLTDDLESCSRRTRKVQLEELVFAALALYPDYYSAESRCFVTTSQMISELVDGQSRSGRGDVTPNFRRKVRRFKRYLWGMFRSA